MAGVTEATCAAVHAALSRRLDSDHAIVMDAMAGLKAAVADIDARLYHDNGRISIQTRVDRHARVIQGVMWVASIVVSMMIAALAAYGARMASTTSSMEARMERMERTYKTDRIGTMDRTPAGVDATRKTGGEHGDQGGGD